MTLRSLLLPVLVLAPLSLGSVACAGNADEGVGAADQNLDTSGCSGLDTSQVAGPVRVTSARPPTVSCWNTPTSGLSLTYSWTQVNQSTSQKKNVGFWTAINDVGQSLKATSYQCTEASSGGLSPDTSGNRTYNCTASGTLTFSQAPDMQKAAYGADGHRKAWAVQVAVSLDDGTWDSLNGANYRLSL